MIHSRVRWMSLPVDRSMMVSAPQRVAHTIFSTSSEISLRTAELPILAFTLTANRLPIIIGSDSGWRWLAGITARPAATSSRTTSGSKPSRAATKRISSVTISARAQANWVDATRVEPARGSAGAGSGRCHESRVGGRPRSTAMSADGSVYGPEVSYTSRWSPLVSAMRRCGTRSVPPC